MASATTNPEEMTKKKSTTAKTNGQQAGMQMVEQHAQNDDGAHVVDARDIAMRPLSDAALFLSSTAARQCDTL